MYTTGGNVNWQVITEKEYGVSSKKHKNNYHMTQLLCIYQKEKKDERKKGIIKEETEGGKEGRGRKKGRKESRMEASIRAVQHYVLLPLPK